MRCDLLNQAKLSPDSPAPQRGPFIKEDGERVIDDHGRRIAAA